MKKYIEFLNEREEDIVSLIKNIVEIESPTSNKEKTNYLGEILVNIFEKYIGGEIEVIPNNEFGNHIIATAGKGEEQVLLVGHFDTVHPVGTLKRNPFKDVNGKIHGPGIYDMKAGIIQALYALHTLKEFGELESKKFKLILNSDEEIGSKTSKSILVKEAKKSKIAFVLEPSFGEEGAIKIARKGVATYNIKVYGTAAHAGNCPEEGESAIEEISHQVLKLEQLNDFKKGITVNCGVINGGSTKNTIPEYASLKVDVRVPTVKDSHTLHEEIINLKPINPNITLEIEGGFTRPPMEMDDEVEEVYEYAKSLMEDNYNFSLPKAHVGGASDGNNISSYVTTLDGFGAVGAGAHSVDEYIYRKFIVPRTALLTALLANL